MLTRLWLVIQVGQIYWFWHRTNILLLFMCAMKNQILTSHVIAWRVFVIILTNYMVYLKSPYYKLVSFISKRNKNKNLRHTVFLIRFIKYHLNWAQLIFECRARASIQNKSCHPPANDMVQWRLVPLLKFNS